MAISGAYLPLQNLINPELNKVLEKFFLACRMNVPANVRG